MCPPPITWIIIPTNMPTTNHMDHHTHQNSHNQQHGILQKIIMPPQYTHYPMQCIAKKLKDDDPRIHQLIIPTIMPTTNHATIRWRRGSLQLHYHTYRSISKYTLFQQLTPLSFYMWNHTNVAYFLLV